GPNRLRGRPRPRTGRGRQGTSGPTSRGPKRTLQGARPGAARLATDSRLGRPPCSLRGEARPWAWVRNTRVAGGGTWGPPPSGPGRPRPPPRRPRPSVILVYFHASSAPAGPSRSVSAHSGTERPLLCHPTPGPPASLEIGRETCREKEWIKGGRFLMQSEGKDNMRVGVERHLSTVPWK